MQGTLLGLFAIAVLQNGLRLADLPAELSGVLTGVLLLVSIGLDRKPGGGASQAHAASIPDETYQHERLNVKNTQVAVICAAILAGACFIAGSNFLMVRELARNLVGREVRSLPKADEESPSDSESVPARQITVAMMPKSKGNAYFIACRKGAEEAAKELGVKLLWDGPTDPDPARQNEIVDTWITRGVGSLTGPWP